MDGEWRRERYGMEEEDALSMISLHIFWPFGAVDLVYFLIIIGTSFTFDVELIHSTFRVPMWLFRLWPLTKSIPRLGYSNNLP